MTGIAGYKVTLRRSGTPTATTGESFSATTAANQYQIDDTAKRVLDRGVKPAGFQTSTGGSISSTDIDSVDYLFGKVTFKSTHGASVNGDVTYFPMQNVAGANSFTLNHTGDLLDDTDFTSTGYRSRVVGLRDVNLSVTRWDSIDVKFYNELSKSSEDTVVVAEVQPEPGSPTARGYYVVESENRSGDVAALESAELSLQLDGNPEAAFSWSDL